MTKFLILMLSSLVLAGTTPARGETIFESGTLGPTGLSHGSVAGSNITPNVFAGVRFELVEPVRTTRIGGHFADLNNGTFFGAIVELGDDEDFPDSGDLSTPDVIGHTVLAFPNPSAEVFGDLDLVLDPGWYALLFGSGLFGTDGQGGAPSNNPDIAAPDYIAFQPGSGWLELQGFLSDFRFVIEGTIVPEPSTISLATLTVLFFAVRRSSRCVGHTIFT